MNANPHEIEPDLQLNWQMAVDILTRFIHTEVTRAGFERVVIGLSGGVDSALSAALAVKALGKGNVFALNMPYRESSAESISHARMMADLLEVDMRTVDISPMAEPYFQENPQISNLRRGNFLARLRMATLFDISAEKRALVLGTGNKTEGLLGYTTWYGDCACSLNPIGDLYKTQVWELSAYLGIPESIIRKSPSADLWKGQTDEGEMGIKYPTADSILYRLVDLRLKPEEIIKQGFDKDTLYKIMDMIKRNHFKGVMPPIAKISSRTIGVDFIYAHDWGS